MRIKRWAGALVLGLLILSLGVADLLVELYLRADRPEWLRVFTLQVLPVWARLLVFVATGVGLCALALRGLYRTFADALGAHGSNGDSLLDMVYSTRLRESGPRIVCVGGGTGMPSVLSGMKHYTSNITAIVTVGDDGGSSGRLRREHGILPPGDFRNNIVALAEAEPLMGRLFQYRFGAGSPLEGHSFGNLFVLAMCGVTGNFEQALRETSRVLAVKGAILPSTLEDVEICAVFEDGTETCGESHIPEAGKRIDRVYLRPESPSAHPDAVKAILEADMVVLGPGSLFTSVMPNLLVEGIAKAVEQSEAVKVYVCNVATQPGETDGFDVDAHVEAMVRHLPGQVNPFDYVIVNRQRDDDVPPEGDVRLVNVRPAGGFEQSSRVRIVEEDVVRDNRRLRHDPEKLAQVLLRAYYEREQPRH